MSNEIEEVREEGNEQSQESSAGVSRRKFVGTAALVGASLATLSAGAQTQQTLLAARSDDSASNPGPKNELLMQENPDSNLPPFTDHGDPGVTWFSFDLTSRRVQDGGWTHQVTEREFPTSRDIAGVNMRLTAGSIRELHWHTSNEWAIVLTGTSRITVMQPDGKMYIDDVGPGDLWYFPAGFPHSIQAMGGQGTEFLLVFDDGKFSENDTFLISETLVHTPPEIIQKNMGWSRDDFNKLPQSQLYIFPSSVPGSLEAEKRALGDRLETKNKYTYKLSEQRSAPDNAGGSVKVIDVDKFPVATGLCAAQVTLKPGAIREMHWHPHSSEWQYYMQGNGRMTISTTGGRARTMNFNANDVGYVPIMATHYIENTGTEDLIFLEILKAAHFYDVSVNEWIARLPDNLAEAHIKLPLSTIRKAPQTRTTIIPK
ncbi:oxalate decarboxylase [Silvibacterium bohemicum]|uniref:Oxalate decarboxylase n=1 Tax=Silvibacterium bohemicum TaxID=1577686 RepID=A0A841K1A0_9BACT|nr:cupin domain-containing protein [Silvibacterium bohemicum]MBB6144428.1 oxalate decarboxylase [Silvibacterium bohemicum]